VMDLETLIMFVIRASIFLMVFSLGLSASVQEALYLVRRPGLLVRSLLAMNVAMPIVAAVLATAFTFRRSVEIALIALAVSPVPPILPKKEFKAGGRAPYVIGLLVTAAALAIVFVPGALNLLGRLFGRPLDVPLRVVASLALITVLVPLAIGMAVRRVAPALAERMAGRVGAAAAALLVLAALPVLVGSWRAIVSLIGNGTIVAFAAFVVVGIAVGHLLGGPDPDNRSVLALATSTRHPGIAMAVAHVTFPGEKLVLPAIALYLVVAIILTLPYVKWRQRARVRQPA
jgi:BASS family bile acid:Na+ symporter